MKKRSDGRYCKQVLVGYHPNGKRKMKTIYGKTIKEVEKKERELRSQIDMGLCVTRDITINEWADEWLSTYKNNLSYYTIRRYRSIVNVHVKPTIGTLKLSQVKLSHIQKIINNLEDYSISSIKKVRDAIHQMYVAAIANELAIKDPTIGLVLSNKEQKEKNAISDNDIKRINDFYQKTNCGVFVMTLLYSGMRRGEIAALTWNDIDFDNNIIHIDKAVVFKNNQPTISTPKTKNSIRDVPLLDNLKTILLEYKKEYVLKYGKNYEKKNVFLNGLGNPHSENSINKMWRKFLKDYNDYYESEVKFGMHQCRHTFCTMLYNADVDIKTAQAVLGHSDISVTLRIYTHLGEKQKKLSIDKLNNYISQDNSKSVKC